MMKLLIETPEGVSEFEFKNEAVLGRDASCEIQILDPLSSRRHCRIFKENEKLFVEDLNSSNGTKLNGESIKKVEFNDSDVIQIGQVKIKQVKTVVESPTKKAIEQVVIVVKNSEKTKEYTFEKEEIVFGREDTNDVTLNEKMSSRKQFKFIINGDKVFIEDLGSSNGTKIKNEKITGKIPYQVGAVVFVGTTEITLNFKNVINLPILMINRQSEHKELIVNGEIIFGRDASCQFVLQEQNASRRHFRVYKEGDNLFVEDLKSSNGTRFNGTKITVPVILRQGDVISVGETYVTLKKTAADNTNAEIPPDVWKVSVSVDLETREYGLYSGMEVGRGEDCAIIIKDAKSSRKHFKFIIEDNKIFVEDLGSSNGTKVDGLATIKREVNENNLIEVGKTKIKIARGFPDKNLNQTIKSYHVLKCMEVGDNGIVYVGRQTTMKRLVALKFVAEKFLESDIKKQNFLKDTIELAKVQHPHLLTILESFSHRVVDRDVQILVTEYVEGLPLSQRIQKKGKIEINNAVHFIEQACAALEALHAKNLYHKNLKPSVFLITKDGKVKLADAGLSKPELKSEYELSTEAIWYEAPERTKGKPASAASDIYELGATLYHALTGRVPFEGKTALAVNTKKINMLPEEPSKVDSNISVGLNKIIMKCMQIEPAARYASVGELKRELEALNAAPVVWDAGDDYRQFERIKRQDYQSILWISAGVLAILGIAVNWFAIETHFEERKLYQAFERLDTVVTNNSIDANKKIKELHDIMSDDYPPLVKDKAKDLLDKIQFALKDTTPAEQIQEYNRALQLINEGGDKIVEGWKVLKELSEKVSSESTFGKKVIKKERAIRAIIKSSN